MDTFVPVSVEAIELIKSSIRIDQLWIIKSCLVCYDTNTPQLRISSLNR